MFGSLHMYSNREILESNRKIRGKQNINEVAAAYGNAPYMKDDFLTSRRCTILQMA